MEEREAFLKAARAEPRPHWLTLPTPPVERSVGEAGASTLAATIKRLLRSLATQPTDVPALLPSLIGSIVETVGDTALLRKSSVSQKRNRSSRTPVIVVLIVAASVIIGTLIAVRPTAPTTPTQKLLQKIEFNYPDSPVNHGWQLLNLVSA